MSAGATSGCSLVPSASAMNAPIWPGCGKTLVTTMLCVCGGSRSSNIASEATRLERIEISNSLWRARDSSAWWEARKYDGWCTRARQWIVWLTNTASRAVFTSHRRTSQRSRCSHMISQTIKTLMLRELRALRREIEAYPDELLLWRQSGGVTNSAGNLALHLCGNLQHF